MKKIMEALQGQIGQYNELAKKAVNSDDKQKLLILTVDTISMYLFV